MSEYLYFRLKKNIYIIRIYKYSDYDSENDRSKLEEKISYAWVEVAA